MREGGPARLVFAEGQVLTSERGSYIKDEAIGIRLETDVIITKDGVEDLLTAAPIEVDEIEKLMN